MITIAITGTIGSGKTTVTDYLLEKGYTVIDADEMARNITSPGGKAIPYIIEHFGKEYIMDDGSMNRSKMRDLIFTDPKQKSVLENGTTKVVIEDIKSIINSKKNSGSKVVFFSVPQLFENKLQEDYDYIWSVMADRNIKKERIKKRDAIPDNIIDLIISSQAEDEIFSNNSDEIIVNNSTIENLHKCVDSLLSKYSL